MTITTASGKDIPSPYSPLGKMKPARKKEFLAFLEAPPSEGGYLQAQSTLTETVVLRVLEARKLGIEPGKHDRFCCLGAATNEMVKKGLLTWDTINVPKTESESPHIDSVDYWYDDGDGQIGLKEWKAEQKKKGRTVVKIGNSWQSYEITYEHSGMPGHAVLAYYGLTPDAASYLAGLNDAWFTFSDIAQAVREYL